jgi:hypothetical protein
MQILTWHRADGGLNINKLICIFIAQQTLQRTFTIFTLESNGCWRASPSELKMLEMNE